MLADDNQAQRNLDPAFCLPFAQGARPITIEKMFLLENRLDEQAVFAVKAAGKLESRWVKATFHDVDSPARITLKAGEKRKVKLAFQVHDTAEVGDNFRLPLEISRINPRPMALGGITCRIEVAIGRLEGCVVAHEAHPLMEGAVRIANIKQPACMYEARVDRKGRFSFKDIVPGPYSIVADCPEGHGKSSVFVEPNRITRKIMRLEPQHIWIGKLLEVAATERVAAR